MMMSGYYTGHPATADEVGAAECYKAALVFAAAPAHQPVAPPWAQAIHQQLVHLRDDLAGVRADIVGVRNDITVMRNEQPILLANGCAVRHEPLYNPTVPGWVLLAAPHPTTRDQLLTFTREFLRADLFLILTMMLHRGAMHGICGCAGPATFTPKCECCNA
jgi:hypothetical protein